MSSLVTIVANGQKQKDAAEPSRCHSVECMCQPGGCSQLSDASRALMTAPDVTVRVAFVAPHPAHSSKLYRFFQYLPVAAHACVACVRRGEPNGRQQGRQTRRRRRLKSAARRGVCFVIESRITLVLANPW